MKMLLPQPVGSRKAWRQLRHGLSLAHNILHLRSAAVGVLLFSAALLLAQRFDKAGSRLRAVALLELAADGHARLVPIAIKVDEKYYDASVYRADPYPMALGQNTVYEAERAGESVGLFTVTGVQKAQDSWVGVGRWQSNRDLLQAEKTAKAAPRRADADQRPILRRAKPVASTAPQPTPEAMPADETSQGSAAKPGENAGTTSPPDDSDRPVLRRGKPTTTPTADQPPRTVGAVAAAQSSSRAGSPPAPSAPAMEMLAAISDADGPAPHSYALPLKTEERDRYQQSMRQRSYEAIRQYAAARPQHKPAEAAALAGVRFQAYDALNNKEPDLVLTASLPELLPPGATSNFRYFVTVVARVDMYGETRLLFAQVTDSAHLDAYPRLELIDVVDAAGSRTGQLLFRRISDTGYSFALYRIGLDQLWPLFEGAETHF